MTTREKAIVIAMKYHFCNLDALNDQHIIEMYHDLKDWIADRLPSDVTLMSDYPDAIIWEKFADEYAEDFPIDDLIAEIENYFPA